MSAKLNLLPPEELAMRLTLVREAMEKENLESILVSSNANIYYLTGRVIAGYILVTPLEIFYFVRRPLLLEDENLFYIRKPEDIPSLLPSMPAGKMGFEMEENSYNVCSRLMAIFPGIKPADADKVLRIARSVKTPGQISLIEQSGIRQTAVYEQIPSLYRSGMTDVDLQIAIETLSRRSGCLGQFRISGSSMELFMANILAGDNADTPTPYDFAMGGAGQNPSLPVGADGSVIKPGMTVMVDCNGNYTGYMTDMTRVFSRGVISDLALKAHECSRHICRELAALGIPGVEAKALYARAEEIVREEGLDEYFMGHNQKAGFIGHGLGIEINELPVIAPRSRDILHEGNVIALEPKFVIPGTGAVGIENTYLVTPGGNPMRLLTFAPEEILPLI